MGNGIKKIPFKFYTATNEKKSNSNIPIMLLG